MLLLKADWTQAQVLAAFVTGIVSIVVAIWTFITGRINQNKSERVQREMEMVKTELATKMELLKDEIAERKADRDARRVYQFEARKKLYQEYEPLLFQLIDAADNALHRIQSLARTARNDDLGEEGWLSDFGYYTKSTIYKLFAPLAIYQIMQRKLTLVDVSVDRSIGLYYKLIKQAYLSYTDDFEFARSHPKISYDPNNEDWEELRKGNPVTYWRQGLPMGLLDMTIEFLIEKGEKERVISYGEFEKRILNDYSIGVSDVDLSKDVFFLFHPGQRPVLWRMLITQAVIFRALLELKKVELDKIDDQLVRELLLEIPDEFITHFNWGKTVEVSAEKNIEPFEVAKEYLAKRF